MNNFLKILAFSLLLLFSFGCKSNKKSITLNIINSENPVILRYNKEYEKIVKIQVPVVIRVTNNSFERRIFNSLKYQYGDYRKGIGTIMYINKNNGLIRLKNNKNIELAPSSKIDYIIYSTHRLDSSLSVQHQFESYIDKIQALDQDTLIAGTAYEFKKTHKKLFDSLTKNDSISIRFINSKNKKSLGETIKIPVEYE